MDVAISSAAAEPTSREYLFDEHPAMFRNNPIGFIISLLLIPVLGVGLIILLVWWVKAKGERIMITDREIVVERGILSKHHTEIAISGIRTINVRQSFTDRIFGVGSIEIFTAGDNAEAHIKGITNPHQVRELVRGRQEVVVGNA